MPWAIGLRLVGAEGTGAFAGDIRKRDDADIPYSGDLNLLAVSAYSTSFSEL